MSTDLEILDLLYCRDHKRMSSSQIAKATDRTRGSVIGTMHRVDKEADKHECECVVPQNKDGGMSPRWYSNPEEQRREIQRILGRVTASCEMPK